MLIEVTHHDLMGGSRGGLWGGNTVRPGGGYRKVTSGRREAKKKALKPLHVEWYRKKHKLIQKEEGPKGAC